jgi:predicted nucleic acid-binding protein
MAKRVIVLDSGIIIEISKGGKPVAEKLREFLKPESGVEVYLTQQAYEELTAQPGKLSGGSGPDLPREAAANKRLLEDLNLKPAPVSQGAWKSVVDTYQRNNKAGPLLSVEDLRSAAQAIAMNAEFWTLDQKTFVKQPQNSRRLCPA